MEPWLTDEILEHFYRSCMSISKEIGMRMDSRLVRRMTIDERALTEDFVDSFDSGLPACKFHSIHQMLADSGIYLHTTIEKSTREFETGADIGLILHKNVPMHPLHVSAEYACLVQCKKLDPDGRIEDFFHAVRGSGRWQGELMLEQTPSSFYFIYCPPSLLDVYGNVEPIGFARFNNGHNSVAVWNIGCLSFPNFQHMLSRDDVAGSVGIMVVPALSVHASVSGRTRIDVDELLSNSMPFWFWFGLFLQGYFGDQGSHAIRIARNVVSSQRDLDVGFSVRHSVTVGVSRG